MEVFNYLFFLFLFFLFVTRIHGSTWLDWNKGESSRLSFFICLFVFVYRSIKNFSMFSYFRIHDGTVRLSFMGCSTEVMGGIGSNGFTSLSFDIQPDDSRSKRDSISLSCDGTNRGSSSSLLIGNAYLRSNDVCCQSYTWLVSSYIRIQI